MMASIVFVCVFGGALLGILLRAVMPEHHLSDDSKDVIKLGMGLIATIAALVLGLVIAAAKNTYDTQDAAIKHTVAKIMLLDDVLARYGPEANEARDSIRRTLARRLDEIWPEERSKTEGEASKAAFPTVGADGVVYNLWQLAPKNDAQRGLQARALQIGGEILETRWFVLGSMGRSVPLPFLIVVVFWLTIIFISFGIFAPRNATVIAVMFVCALSIACAIFLILEMDQPFSGVMKISSAPLRFALSHLSN
jgi:hypothetical protein